MGVFEKTEERAARRRRRLRRRSQVVNSLATIGCVGVAVAIFSGIDLADWVLVAVLAVMGAGLVLALAAREPGDAAATAAVERDAEIEAQRIAAALERHAPDDPRTGSPRI